ncbi:hypothetical protein M422DRAFT_266403 [Sphaerobolus stellatus SS14]|uniref:CxC1-like cysteine cluster associated with KDZ transposases domain-containing protein n=1 Tax=Sphaerobolus stellatus (strain SS14) TaxID=990650 RepID=A0A0C9V333_SPHS4|nr:hypothetical protein M422DRAFT_266403 [Sphaerobolus stellatus SS14]
MAPPTAAPRKKTKRTGVLAYTATGSPIKISRCRDGQSASITQAGLPRPKWPINRKPIQKPPNSVWRDGRWVSLELNEPLQSESEAEEAANENSASPSRRQAPPRSSVFGNDIDMDDGSPFVSAHFPASPAPPPCTTATVGLDNFQSFWQHPIAHCKRCQTTWPEWRSSVLPAVIPLFLEAERMLEEWQPLPLLHNMLGHIRYHNVICIERTNMFTTSVPYCLKSNCTLIAKSLVHSGFFPCSPVQPTTAFSFEILQSYVTLNPELIYSVALFQHSLVKGLREHGFRFSSKEPFKYLLPDALIWFDAMKYEVELRIRRIIHSADTFAQGLLAPSMSTPQQSTKPPESPSQYADIHLRQLCPACFGQQQWGGNPEVLPDVHVAIDGNFTHRHYASVADDPMLISLSDPSIWLMEGELEMAKKYVQERQDHTHGVGRQQAHVPTGSLDECKNSHNAARDRGDEASEGVMASKGLMAMVCRHDVPLIICDIVTPGEQRFYAIALIQKLANRSIAKHNLIPDIAPRLSLATAAFHAYAHQFCCQVVFNPRKRVGFGMTNGEGNERIWALSKDTIGSERISGPNKQFFLLTRKFEYIGTLKRRKLVSWRTKKIKSLNEEEIKCNEIMAPILREWSVEQLWQQWKIQQDTQLSACAYSAHVANQNLASLIESQKTAESLTHTLDALSKELDRHEFLRLLGKVAPDSLDDLYIAANELQHHHQESISQLEELTASLGLLNIDLPPDMSKDDTAFMKKLILLQAVKTTLWNRLQRVHDEMNPIRELSSQSGQARSLGTKKLQTAIRAIQGRT